MDVRIAVETPVTSHTVENENIFSVQAVMLGAQSRSTTKQLGKRPKRKFVMKTPLSKLTKSDIFRAVDRQRDTWAHYSKTAMLYLVDPQKKERHEKQYCVCCFYQDAIIAGQAFTESQCGVCEKEMQWSTTHQEKLCDPCAKKYGLCKECGATIDLKWPRSDKFDELK